jgi:magnesium chelatase family protein
LSQTTKINKYPYTIEEIRNTETQQPSEDGNVTISRAVGSLNFPARFMMVAAMNPCPCGFYGDSKRQCRCTVRQIENYRKRISGPLLDRIDLHIEVPLVDFRELSSTTSTSESSATIRERVVNARRIQQERFHKSAQATNAAMTPRQMKVHCQINDEARGYLEHAMEEMNFSARAHDRILKVARTLADLAGAETIRPNDLLEAIQYRSLDRKLFS